MPEIQVYRRRLPHWRMDGAVYFVTWRLHQAQKSLDSAERDTIASAIRFFDGQRYLLYSFVVMDDHVHVVIQPTGKNKLEQILRSWKGFTAQTIRKATGRPMPLWQSEYMDRILRDERELEEKVQYVLDNPYRRWAEINHYEWSGTGSALE